MRRLWIFLVASLLLALAIPALAQEDWECFYDFTAGDAGWTATGTLFSLSTRDGSGWNDVLLSGSYRGVSARTTFDATVTVTSVTVDLDRTEGVTSGFTSDTHHLEPGIWLVDYETDPTEPLIVTGSWSIASLEFKFFAGINFSGDPGGNVTVHSVTLEGTGDSPCDDEEPPETELTRPLQPTDRLFAVQSLGEDLILGTETLANEAVIFGAKKNALVSAVTDGVVTEIEPLTKELCYELFEPQANPDLGDQASAEKQCRVTLAANANQAGDYIELFSLTDNPPPIYVIHIAGIDGREYLQIATDVDNYVFEGQTVSAGCWLGRAISLPSSNGASTIGTIVSLYAPITGALIQIFGQNQQPFEALTAVWVLDEPIYVNAWDEYILDPSDSAACNTPEGYEGCMGDSRLEDPSQWQSSNGVSWTDPGALMSTGSFIAATFNLDADRDPVAIIGGTAAPLGNLAITFGTTNDPVNGILGATEIEIAPGEPDEGEFYTLRLTNTGDTPIRLAFICVVHDEARGGGPAPRPPVTTTTICYFIDSSFENGIGEWVIDGDVEEDDGALLLPDDASIEQDLELTAGTYTLVVVTEVWGTGAYEADDENITGGIEIEYAYPATTFVSMGTKTWADYTHRTQTFTDEIVIASDEDGTFTIRPNTISEPTGVLGVRINSACLTKEGEIDGGPGDGLITPTCGTIATPTLSATQPGTWTTWLWAQLNKFYRCELIKVLNEMLTVMTNFFRTSLWQIRWTQAAVIRFGNFTSTGFYWLNGHLHNIAVGRVYVVEGGTGYDQAGDIGDVILGGLKSVIDLFISLLQRVIDFVFYLLQLVFQLALAVIVTLIRLAVVLVGLIIGALGQLFDLINALFFAWNNAEAVPIAGMPQCAIEPKEAPVCMLLWTLENTIFSGRGFLFIPFMIAYGSAELLLWAVAKFSKRAEETGQSG